MLCCLYDSWLCRSPRCLQNGICNGSHQCYYMGSRWDILVEVLGSILIIVSGVIRFFPIYTCPLCCGILAATSILLVSAFLHCNILKTCEWKNCIFCRLVIIYERNVNQSSPFSLSLFLCVCGWALLDLSATFWFLHPPCHGSFHLCSLSDVNVKIRWLLHLVFFFPCQH